MDYSLLLGIENRPKSEEKELMTPGGGRQSRIRAEMRRLTVKNNMDVAALRRHRFISPDSYETYHVSVIDYLQQWNANKKGERFLKTKLLGKKGDDLSAIEPITYQDRFVKVLTGRCITVCQSEKTRATAQSFQ